MKRLKEIFLDLFKEAGHIKAETEDDLNRDTVLMPGRHWLDRHMNSPGFYEHPPTTQPPPVSMFPDSMEFSPEEMEWWQSFYQKANPPQEQKPDRPGRRHAQSLSPEDQRKIQQTNLINKVLPWKKSL
jgi:hypothetical protein